MLAAGWTDLMVFFSWRQNKKEQKVEMLGVIVGSKKWEIKSLIVPNQQELIYSKSAWFFFLNNCRTCSIAHKALGTKESQHLWWL